MSIWGKILGGAAGFAIGGPLGALLGAVGGHIVDRMRAETAGEASSGQPGAAGGPDNTRSVAFTIAVIVLGAKMAKADGQVTQDEIRAFKEVFRVPPDEMDNVAKVFNQARRDSAGFELYARQVASMFRESPAVLEELLWCLTHIARADGVIHPSELAFLRKVAEIFGLDEAAFERITALRQGPGAEADPYKVLGVTRAMDTDAIKAAHRALVRENHPDRLIAQGMPEEFVATANQKLAAINAAWDRIKTERGVS